MQTTKPGTLVVSVRGVAGGRGYYAPGVYEAVARKADGVLTWRLVANPLGLFSYQGRQMVTGYRSERKARRSADSVAETRGIRSLYGIRHGQVCS